jgi:hypothetical protein
VLVKANENLARKVRLPVAAGGLTVLDKTGHCRLIPARQHASPRGVTPRPPVPFRRRGWFPARRGGQRPARGAGRPAGALIAVAGSVTGTALGLAGAAVFAAS